MRVSSSSPVSASAARSPPDLVVDHRADGVIAGGCLSEATARSHVAPHTLDTPVDPRPVGEVVGKAGRPGDGGRIVPLMERPGGDVGIVRPRNAEEQGPGAMRLAGCSLEEIDAARKQVVLHRGFNRLIGDPVKQQVPVAFVTRVNVPPPAPASPSSPAFWRCSRYLRWFSGSLPHFTGVETEVFEEVGTPRRATCRNNPDRYPASLSERVQKESPSLRSALGGSAVWVQSTTPWLWGNSPVRMLARLGEQTTLAE